MADEFETNLREVLGRVSKDLNRKRRALAVEIKRALEKDAIRWERAMLGSFTGRLVLEGRKGEGEPLASRRGNAGLRGQFFTEVRGSNLGSQQGIELRKGNSSIAAALHEFGGEIVPKKARALTIPLKAAMTAGGVPREPSARHWEDAFFLGLNKGGNTIGYLVRDVGGGELEFLYRLAKRVKIPARLGMRKTHEEQEDARARDIQEAIQNALGA